MHPEPIKANEIPAASGTVYPAEFAQVVAGRIKRKLGNEFGLNHFGVNLTELQPGAASALFHAHSAQDEFIYILEGTATLRLGEKEFEMNAGDCAGFPAGTGVAHQLRNNSAKVVRYLETGDRTAGDQVDYPEDDLKANMQTDGTWLLTRKDGRPI